MRCIPFLLVGLILAAGPSSALDLAPPPPVDPDRKSLPVTSRLLDFAENVTSLGLSPAAVMARAAADGLTGRADGRINVEILAPDGAPPVTDGFVARFGGSIDATYRGQVSAWIPPTTLRGLAGALPPGYFMRDASVGDRDNEGPLTIGSDVYRDGGADGSGITIAVIDDGFMNLTTAQDSGAAPASITTQDYPGNGFQTVTRHGTGVIETIFDHAPGATYFAYLVGNSTHTALAVDNAILNGVDIISMSKSYYNQGWDDGSGAVNAAVNDAADSGRLFFCSSGNRARTHYQDTFASPDLDSWHEFTPGVETNAMTVQVSGTITLYLSWDGASDLDLYLVDSTGATLDSSIAATGFESLSWTNNSSGTRTVAAAVRLFSGSAVEFEIFNRNTGGSADFQFVTAASSTATPSNNTRSSCISVGAILFNDYTMNGLAGYSSQGPTNSGNQAPDLTGPTNTFSVAYNGAFTGTSCATPNAAGAAAALWSSAPGLTSAGVRQILLRQAVLLNDFGAAGADPVFGHGAVSLYPYESSTTWVHRGGGNDAGVPALPYKFMNDAQLNAVSNGRTLILGGSYPEPIVLDSEQKYVSAGESAVIGGN